MALSPGFANPVRESQHTFRQLLEALSRPGHVCDLAPELVPPPGLTPACAAACLTLLDLETTVWLGPDWPSAVMTWLAFHTGVRRSLDRAHANFALLDLTQLATATDFDQLMEPPFPVGTPTAPEAACTLLIQVPGLSDGPTVQLKGPGIQHRRLVSPRLPVGFWQWWTHNHRQYPLGIDVFLFSPTQAMGLPRSVEGKRPPGD